jgi:hypothetical protein
MSDFVLVPRDRLQLALDRARVFDDGSDGADGESAASVVRLLAIMLASAPPSAEPVTLRDELEALADRAKEYNGKRAGPMWCIEIDLRALIARYYGESK